MTRKKVVLKRQRLGAGRGVCGGGGGGAWMTNTQTPPHATTVVIPTGAPATNTVANHAERPEKFNGTDI
ncbi:hypothetical protein Tco_1337757 [Tanacetum coccineum]